MTNTLVPHEIAVKLKEKGFSEPCSKFYHPTYGESSSSTPDNYNRSSWAKGYYSAPDIYQAAAWLRVVKGLHVAAVVADGGGSWVSEVQDIATGNYIEPAFIHPDHDTAYIAGILNALKLVK